MTCQVQNDTLQAMPIPWGEKNIKMFTGPGPLWHPIKSKMSNEVLNFLT